MATVEDPLFLDHFMHLPKKEEPPVKVSITMKILHLEDLQEMRIIMTVNN
jgi:hypothetical protein